MDMFAATPPLEAKKLLFAAAVTGKERGNNNKKKLSFIDVKRAFFHATQEREIYVELPPDVAK